MLFLLILSEYIFTASFILIIIIIIRLLYFELLNLSTYYDVYYP